MADFAIPDVGGFMNGIQGYLNNGMLSLLVAFQLPLWIIWIFLTLFIVYIFIFSRITIVLPWSYKFKATKILPFANKKIGVMQDQGAFVSEAGMLRFKMKAEAGLLQKPDSSEIYDNNEIIVISFSRNKKCYGKRILDYKNYHVIFEIGDPTVSDEFFFGTLEKNDPNWLMKNLDKHLALATVYSLITALLWASNMLVLFPVLMALIYKGG
jgi:hypothetical protein